MSRHPNRKGVARVLEEVAMAIDPVCHTEVDEAKASARSEYKGKTYYFSASGCRKEFEEDPDRCVTTEW